MQARLTMHERRREIEDALRASGGDRAVAARSLGISVGTFYQRARRAGLDALMLERSIRESSIDQAVATLEQSAGSTVVRLSLSDFATLKTLAAEGIHAADLARDLDTANRIIATLTARLQEVAA